MKIRAKTNSNIYVSSDQVVDRSTWRFGGGGSGVPGGTTSMLNGEGNMCCLGQVCHNSGFGKDLLLDRAYPKSVLDVSEFLDIPGLAESLPRGSGVFVYNTDFTKVAAQINDRVFSTLERREKALKVHFKKHGFDLTFKGEYTEEALRYHIAA